MLNSLREIIQVFIHSNHPKGTNTICRTIVLISDPSLFPVKDWLNSNLSLIAPETECFCPWILWDSDKDISKIISDTINTLMDPKNINDATMKGYKIIESYCHILVIGNLENSKSIVNSCGVIKSVFDKISPINISVHYTGILLINNIANNGQDHNNTFDNLLEKLGKNFFQKVFLLDKKNQSGIVINDMSDIHCLIATLIYFLYRFSVQTTSNATFSTWLQENSIFDGYVTGFSSMFFILPIAQIIEAAAVQKSKELVRASICSENSDDKSKYFFEHFLQRSSTANFDTIKQLIQKNAEDLFLKALENIPSYEDVGLEKYLARLDELQASLPNLAKESETTLEKNNNKDFTEWKYLLEHYLDSIITYEKGGVFTAKNFLCLLEKRYSSIRSKDMVKPIYIDPATAYDEFKMAIAKIPSNSALLLRLLLFSLSTEIITYYSPLSNFGKMALMVGTPLLAGFLVMLQIHMAKARMQNKLITFKNLLLKKWEALFNCKIDKLIGNYAELCSQYIKGRAAQIDEIEKRVKELVSVFERCYAPLPCNKHATWLPIIEKQSDYENYFATCTLDINQIEKDYIAYDAPLKHWRRLSPSGTNKLNSVESQIFELAAIRVLPYCNEIFKADVYELIEKGTNRFKAIKDIIRRTILPFLNFDRENVGKNPELILLAEMDEQNNRPNAHDLVKEMEKDFATVKKIGKYSPYRFAFFGIQDIHKDNVLWR